MNGETIVIYENSIGKIVFGYSNDFWIEEIDGVSNIDVNISDSKGIGQIGSTITEKNIEPRTISIDGSFIEPIIQNRKKLIEIFSPQENGTFTIIQNSESWFLDVVTRKSPIISNGVGIQKFQLELYASYPYWRTTTSYSQQIAGLVAMFRFPFYAGGEWWVSKYTDDYFHTIENTGNVPVEFKAVFVARSALDNPEIYQVDTRKKIALRKSMVAGDKFIVSTIYGQRGVIFIDKNGVSSNGFKYLTVDSTLDMTLLPGENLLRIDAQSNREGLSVRVEAPKGVVSGV